MKSLENQDCFGFASLDTAENDGVIKLLKAFSPKQERNIIDKGLLYSLISRFDVLVNSNDAFLLK